MPNLFRPFQDSNLATGSLPVEKLLDMGDGTWALRMLASVHDGTTMAGVDRLLSALRVIDEIHSQIHRGLLFCAYNIFTAVANDATADILFIAPAGFNVHLRHSCDVGGDVYMQPFVGVTTSNDGTPIAVHNRNQASENVAGATFFHTPTVSNFGSAMCQQYVTGGTGGNAAGGAGLGFGEIIYPAGQKHLLRLTNKSGQARTIAINSHFYEASSTI